jgi:hypothetical protein
VVRSVLALAGCSWYRCARMERRDFLWAGLATLVAGGCASENRPVVEPAAPRARDRALTEAEMREFLDRLDRGMDSIQRGNPLGDVLKEAGVSHPKNETQHAEELYRSSLRSLLIVGSLHDLPAPSRSHPEVQKRLVSALPEMDAAVLGMADHLETLSRDDRDGIRSRLREQPELPAKINDALDRHAALLGISTSRTGHLRALTSQVGWRLRAQPFANVTEPFVDHVRAVARIQNQEHLRVLEQTRVEVQAPSSRAGTVATVGGIILGVGAVTFAGGALIVSGGSVVGLFVMTAGAIGIVAGLITLLVALIMKAAE